MATTLYLFKRSGKATKVHKKIMFFVTLEDVYNPYSGGKLISILFVETLPTMHPCGHGEPPQNHYVDQCQHPAQLASHCSAGFYWGAYLMCIYNYGLCGITDHRASSH